MISKKLFANFVILTLSLIILLSIISLGSAAPLGPSSVNVTNNETKATSSAYEINISGAYIATLNITATVQNAKWKGFVGWLTGKYTLDDATGSTLYDWTLSSITGEVYATRNSTSITWTSINCSNISLMEQENYVMNQSNPNDNISATFDGTTHDPFWVGGRYIYTDYCPTTNLYVNNVTPAGDDVFEEVLLYDGYGSHIYAALLENYQNGFDSRSYDFEMVVPENGAPGFQGSTSYFLYAEIV